MKNLFFFIVLASSSLLFSGGDSLRDCNTSDEVSITHYKKTLIHNLNTIKQFISTPPGCNQAARTEVIRRTSEIVANMCSAQCSKNFTASCTAFLLFACNANKEVLFKENDERIYDWQQYQNRLLALADSYKKELADPRVTIIKDGAHSTEELEHETIIIAAPVKVIQPPSAHVDIKRTTCLYNDDPYKGY